MTEGHEDSWKIGELADSTGLTVRTLHHYDQIGLLRPSGRTASGHRLYGRDDVTRLYQIVALRELGLPLETVKEVLVERPLLGPILDAHLEHVEQRLSAIRALRDRLLVVVAASTATPEVSTDDVLQLIQEVTRPPLRLPAFTAAGMVLYRRVTIIARRDVITHVMYPVFPPDANAADVVAYLSSQDG